MIFNCDWFQQNKRYFFVPIHQLSFGRPYKLALTPGIPWLENTTQQIDLAFNIFFMVYFFIRVQIFLFLFITFMFFV